MSSIVYDATPQFNDRSRLTIFFRGLMMIPHFVVAFVYGIGVFFAVVIAWFALLFTGRYPEGLYNFVGGFSQYSARVNGYYFLLTDQYPPFDLGPHTEYPVRLHVGPPQASYSRASVFFRAILQIPIIIISYVLIIVQMVVLVITWLVAMVTGSLPGGLANALVFTLSYSARAGAYGYLLTDKWPAISQDAGAIPPASSAPEPDFSTGFATPAPPPPPPGNPFGS